MRWNGDGCISCPRAGALVIAERMTKPTTRAIRGRIFISRLLIDLVPWYAVPSPCASAQADLQHTHNAAEDTPIVLSPDALHVCRQVRLDPLPLFVAQPKQFPAHDPNPSLERISIVLSERKINEFSP
jgi:hypothetical protein